jgi:hypothetical protein
MGHVLRINSLHALWMGFIAYNLARAGLVLLRGNPEASRLCLVQTVGLWKGFVAPVPAAAASSAQSHGNRHSSSSSASEHQVIEFPHALEAQHQNQQAQAVFNASSAFHCNDELAKTQARSSVS